MDVDLDTVVAGLVPELGRELRHEMTALARACAALPKAERIRRIETFLDRVRLPELPVDWLELLVGLAHLYRALRPVTGGSVRRTDQ